MLKIDQCKPLKAKLYLGRKRSAHTPYYRVLVFHDRHELRIFAVDQSKILKQRAESRPRHWRTCLGCARHFGGSTPREHPRQVGVVLLCREALGVGIVSHEMTHAALYHVTRKTRGRKNWPMRLSRADDERLAWHQGNLVRQFYNWYWNQRGAG